MRALSIIRPLFRRAAQIGPSRIQIGCADEVIAAITGTFRTNEGPWLRVWSWPQLIEPGKNVIASEMGQPNPRRLALGVALGQAVVALAAAALSWAIADSRAALSAALGGGISSVASLVMALLSFGKEAATDPLRAIRAFFVGEAAKVVVVITLFVVVWKTMKVVPLAMLGAYIATFFVFWVALANGLSTRGAPRANSPQSRADEGR
jgi:ATP synthase protein I